MVTVRVPFSAREVEVTRTQWLACRRVENLMAVLGLSAGSGLFVAGLAVSGLSPLGVLMVLSAAFVYFDGYVSRWCAGRKARKP